MQKASGLKRLSALKDKYLPAVIAIVLILFSIGASAQTTPYFNDVRSNTQQPSVKIYRSLFFPTGCGVPDTSTFHGTFRAQAAEYYDSCGHFRYTWDPSYQRWIKGDSGTGSSGTSIIYLQGFGDNTGQLPLFVVNDTTIGQKYLQAPKPKMIKSLTDSTLFFNELFGYAGGDDSAFEDRTFKVNGHFLEIDNTNGGFIIGLDNISANQLNSDHSIISSFLTEGDDAYISSSYTDDHSRTRFLVTPDSIIIDNTTGYLRIYNVQNAPSSTGVQDVVIDPTTGRIYKAFPGTDSTTFARVDSIIHVNGGILKTSGPGNIITLELGDSLYHNTTIKGGTHNLTITSSIGSSTATIVGTNSGAGGGVSGGSSSGPGVSGSSVSGYGLQGISTSGIAGNYNISPSSTNTQPVVAQFQRQTSATPGVGIGGVLDFQLENSATILKSAAQLKFKYTNITSGSEASELDFLTATGGASPATVFSLMGNGQAALAKYGLGTFTGTAAFALSVDASGNLIETTAGGGGGGSQSWQSVMNIGSTSYGNNLSWGDAGFNDIVTFQLSASSWHHTVFDVNDNTSIITLRASNGIEIAGAGSPVNVTYLLSQASQTAARNLYLPNTNAIDTLVTASQLRAGGGGGNALTSNPLSQFASTTSAQLAGVLSDETGTSLAVFNTSPLFVTPRLASTSTLGYVWTATDGSGNGSFQAPTSGSYTVATAANTANYTVSTSNYILLSDLTGQANRNIVLPTSPATGAILKVKNNNTGSSGFAWTFTNGTVKDYGNNSITTLVNQTVYDLVFDGTNWNINN